jgi:hypothetical protein
VQKLHDASRKKILDEQEQKKADLATKKHNEIDEKTKALLQQANKSTEFFRMGLIEEINLKFNKALSFYKQALQVDVSHWPSMWNSAAIYEK